MELTLPRRFRGPLTSANGGYASGRLAAFVDADAVEVTLRLPPSLDTSLEVWEGRLSRLTFFLETERIFPAFGLPPHLG